MSDAPKKGRQKKLSLKGQPAPRWPVYMAEAHRAIVARGGYRARVMVIEQLGRQIVEMGNGNAFLMAVRRGRPTARQNIRYQLLREVEGLIGDQVPRVREDRNTPEAAKRPKREFSEEPR